MLKYYCKGCGALCYAEDEDEIFNKGKLCIVCENKSRRVGGSEHLGKKVKTVYKCTECKREFWKKRQICSYKGCQSMTFISFKKEL